MKKVSNKQPFPFRFYKIIIIMFGVILLYRYLHENSSMFYRKTFELPFSLHLNKQDLYLMKGEEYKLYVFGINKRVSYYSTNFRVVGVNFNGRLFGYRTGKAFIIAKVDKKELKCRVHVIDLNKKTLELKKSDTYRLRVKGTSAFVSWKSSNKGVATVNMFGKVKAVSPGTTVIYAKVKGKTIKCTVKVK